MTKTCSTCKHEKTLNRFYKKANGKEGYTARCKDCVSIYQKSDSARANTKRYQGSEKYRAYLKSVHNSQKYILKRREHNKQIRITTLNAYGNACQCCGESTYEFLSIDHMNNDGSAHRKEVGNKICRWLRKNNYPEGFQILCHNCNQAKGLYGTCPHLRLPCKQSSNSAQNKLHQHTGTTSN